MAALFAGEAKVVSLYRKNAQAELALSLGKGILCMILSNIKKIHFLVNLS